MPTRRSRKRPSAKPPLKREVSIYKFFFGSRRSSILTLSSICALIIGLSQALPIAWGWVMDARAGAEVVFTQQARTKIKKNREEIKKIKLEQMAMDSRHMNAIQSISKGQQINQETMYNIWSDVRAMRDGTTPPTPEPIPTIKPHDMTASTIPHE